MKQRVLKGNARSLHDRLNRRDAFTLTELLVVIAIIAILVTLLLPVLSRTKKASQGVWCENNLKQLQLAWHLYADDYEGKLVPNKDRGTTTNKTWAAGWLKNTASTPDNTNTLFLTHALLGPYAQAVKLYKCPGDKSVDKGNHLPRVRSVSMNAYMHGLGLGLDPSYLNYQNFAEIDNPSDRWVFIDEREDSVNDGYFRVGMNEDVVRDFPASYHNRAGALSFADGHMEIHKWVTGNITKNISGNGDITSSEPALGNADISWLQFRTTRLR